MENTQVTEKRCSSCGEVKPVAVFSKDSRKKDGLRGYCRCCATKKNLEHYNKNHQEMLERAKMYRAENPDIVAKNNRKYRTENLDTAKENLRIWRENNQDKVRVARKSWAKNNPEKIRLSKKKYAKNNPEKVKALKERAHAKSPEKYAALSNFHSRSRQVRKIQATPAWMDSAAVRGIYEQALRWSGILGIRLFVDHIVPIKSDKVCGLHTWENLQLLEAGANSSKGNYYWPDMP